MYRYSLDNLDIVLVSSCVQLRVLPSQKTKKNDSVTLSFTSTHCRLSWLIWRTFATPLITPAIAVLIRVAKSWPVTCPRPTKATHDWRQRC